MDTLQVQVAKTETYRDLIFYESVSTKSTSGSLGASTASKVKLSPSLYEAIIVDPAL